MFRALFAVHLQEKFYDLKEQNEGEDGQDVLDPNHSHFLLVDDAAYKKGISDNSINLVVNFLSSLDGSQVVTVAFDEKINTIKTVIRNIQYRLPCILLTVNLERWPLKFCYMTLISK